MNTASKTSLAIRLAFLLTATVTTQSIAAMIPDTMSDLTAEPIHASSDAAARSISNFTSPLSFKTPASAYFNHVNNPDVAANNSKGMFYTKYFRNSDSSLALNPDHFAMCRTNRSLVIAAQDVKHTSSTRVLDDRSFTDDLFDLFAFDGSSPAVDEPKPAPGIKSFSIMPPVAIGLVFQHSQDSARPNQRD